jgi:hypothetical protein
LTSKAAVSKSAMRASEPMTVRVMTPSPGRPVPAKAVAS